MPHNGVRAGGSAGANVSARKLALPRPGVDPKVRTTARPVTVVADNAIGAGPDTGSNKKEN